MWTGGCRKSPCSATPSERASASETTAASVCPRRAATADGADLARTLGNLPANICTPRFLAQQARALAKTLTGTVTPVQYPAMPVVVKTPACPTVVCPPPLGIEGAWTEDESADGVRARLAEMGHSLDEFELDKAFARFKELADRKKVITDLDLEAIIADEFYRRAREYLAPGGVFGQWLHLYEINDDLVLSVVRAVLIEPLPYRDPARLQMVWSNLDRANYTRGPISGQAQTRASGLARRTACPIACMRWVLPSPVSP